MTDRILTEYQGIDEDLRLLLQLPPLQTQVFLQK
jgi:hypothetical protein